MNDQKTNRTCIVKVRCTPEEYRRFRKLAEIEGRSISGQIRFLLMSRARDLRIKVPTVYHPNQGTLIE